MTDPIVRVVAAVISVLRRDDSVRGVADRLGVAESVVREWLDIFLIAGAMALRSTCAGPSSYSDTPEPLAKKTASLKRPAKKRTKSGKKKRARK